MVEMMVEMMVAMVEVIKALRSCLLLQMDADWSVCSVSEKLSSDEGEHHVVLFCSRVVVVAVGMTHKCAVVCCSIIFDSDLCEILVDCLCICT